MFTPDRRTCIVLGSLLAAMTIASGLLLLLEPSPVVPVPEMSLSALDAPESPGPQQLFKSQIEKELRQWHGIVIHDSGAATGSAQSIHAVHEKMGLGSLGYHFVVHNGHGGPDGYRTDGPRWRNQQDGAYCAGDDADLYNQNAIGICLIGDFSKTAPTAEQVTQLVDLVTLLQAKFDIEPNRIWVQSAADGNAGPGKFFPMATFQKQLLSPSHGG